MLGRTRTEFESRARLARPKCRDLRPRRSDGDGTNRKIFGSSYQARRWSDVASDRRQIPEKYPAIIREERDMRIFLDQVCGLGKNRRCQWETLVGGGDVETLCMPRGQRFPDVCTHS